MKVLFLRSNPVDPDSRVEKEVKTLLKNGHKVEIFCWDRSSNHSLISSNKKIDDDTCPIYRIGYKSEFGAGFKRNLRPLIQFQNAIINFIKKYHKRYDVIHACDFDTAFSAFKIARKYNIKFVYDIFDYYADAFKVPKILKKAVVQADTKIINKADAVIICSEKRKEQLRNANPKRLVIIHNSPEKVSFNKTNEKDKKNDNSLRIAYVGILNDGRMIPELLKIISTHKNFELHIGGFGKYESLVQEYAERNTNIIYYGRVPYSKTLEIENSSDVLTAIYDPTIPNHRYAAPNKFYEALMLGKPLIMCKGTGFSDVVRTEGFGELIDYNSSSLERALQIMFNNKNHYLKSSEKEKKLYEDKFSWELMSKRLVNLYSSL
jgi:glycosyltransferase involved in cell wall biosynthesis